MHAGDARSVYDSGLAKFLLSFDQRGLLRRLIASDVVCVCVCVCVLNLMMIDIADVLQLTCIAAVITACCPATPIDVSTII